MDISKPDIETKKEGRRGGRIFSGSQRIQGGSISTSGQGRRAELKTAINSDGEQFAALNFWDGAIQAAQVVAGNIYNTAGEIVRRYVGIYAGDGLIEDPTDGVIVSESDFIPFPGFDIDTLPPNLGWAISLGDPTDSPWNYVVALNPLEMISDARKKDDIADTVYGLREILSLRPVSYRLKGHERVNLGFIAQEAKEVIPEAVRGSDDTTYSMSYETIIPVLVKALQEQQAQIAQLTADVQALRTDAVQ